MKRFAAGNIITFGDIGILPINITKGKAYKVQFLREMYSTGIRNDIGEITFNFSGFVDVDDWILKNRGIMRGSEVNLGDSVDTYVVLGFEIENSKDNGNIVVEIKKSHI